MSYANPISSARSIKSETKTTRDSYSIQSDSNCYSVTKHWQIDTYSITQRLTHPYVPRDIFKIFDYLAPDQVKVVIIGQDPYPGKCPITKQYYACGPAFLIPDNVLSCPVSLKVLFTELNREYKLPKQMTIKRIKNCMKSWINQGVFLTNAALTRGIESTYLDDHQMLWRDFTIQFLRSVPDCLIVLLGHEAWSLSQYVNNPLKFPHPASRDNKFIGCSMFTKINERLNNPIKWF
jgi:uracil-DNA glycosylase